MSTPKDNFIPKFIACLLVAYALARFHVPWWVAVLWGVLISLVYDTLVVPQDEDD
jgi:ABC-type glycerol-3-phosphate transport system permease component